VRDSGRIAGLDPGGAEFGPDGRYYLTARRQRTILAMPAALDAEGDDLLPEAIVPFTPRLVTDRELSPLDLKLAPDGNIVVASEWPLGAADAVPSVREYDPITGQLVRVFAPEPSVGFRRPRGLRFGPGVRLYCVGEDHVVAFDFRTGSFIGPVVHLARLNGQSLVLWPR
jgi:hypothetical protein